jgi:hypothetical protein
MSSTVKPALLALLSVVAVTSPVAEARTSGPETLRGQIIAPSKGGTRQVASSIVVARGVFSGAGTVVEVPNRPGDPDSVSRDDLVFPRGRLHIRTTSKPPKLSIDPKTCAFTATLAQTTTAAGGTGAFRNAAGRFTATLHAWGVAARAADGSCDQQADVLIDADAFSARGTLTL